MIDTLNRNIWQHIIIAFNHSIIINTVKLIKKCMKQDKNFQKLVSDI